MIGKITAANKYCVRKLKLFYKIDSWPFNIQWQILQGDHILIRYEYTFVIVAK